METTIIPKQRMLVAKLTGEIDHHSASEIRYALEREYKRTGTLNIALDFGRVTFMDSAGIGMILGRYKTVKAMGGNIIIYDASDQVKRILEMAGIGNIAIITDTLRDAIIKLEGSMR